MIHIKKIAFQEDDQHNLLSIDYVSELYISYKKVVPICKIWSPTSKRKKKGKKNGLRGSLLSRQRRHFKLLFCRGWHLYQCNKARTYKAIVSCSLQPALHV